MKERLLDFLVCPKCSGKFRLETFAEDGGEIKEGLLLSDCDSFYPIINYIPRIMDNALMENPDFAQRYSNRIHSKGQGQPSQRNVNPDTEFLLTRNSFGYQWTRNRFSKMYDVFEEGFLNYIYPVRREFFEGKVGLDAGCGFGRHIYYAAKFGAEIIGVDFSKAVESSLKNTEGLDNVHLVQADIYNLPIRLKSLDFVYCLGVLHHLPDPERGFLCLKNLVKKDGNIFIWVYSGRRKVLNFLLGLIRPFTVRMPYPILYIICLFSTMLDWLLIQIYRSLTHLPGLKKWLGKIYFERIHIYSKYPFNVMFADWFDRLSAPIRFYYGEDDLLRWARRAGLKDVYISPTGLYGWRLLGKVSGKDK